MVIVVVMMVVVMVVVLVVIGVVMVVELRRIIPGMLYIIQNNVI